MWNGRRRIQWVLGLLVVAGGASAAGMQERPDSYLARIQRGTYKILQIVGQDTVPKEIGSETFEKRYFTDNTIVLAGEREMDYSALGGPSGALKQSIHLEIEEESHFPRRYESTKETRGIEQVTTVELYANVAVIHHRFNDREEKSTLVLTTGTILLESDFIHLYALLLHRFGPAASGKRNINVFDPVLKRESIASVEHAGETTVELEDESKNVMLYRITRERYPVMRLYVDEKGTVVKASNGVQEFILDAFEENEFQAPAGE